MKTTTVATGDRPHRARMPLIAASTTLALAASLTQPYGGSEAGGYCR